MDFQEFLDRYQKKAVIIYQDISVQTPIVSVCVQTYQHVNYIKQCLDGILMQQTNFAYEILLGDDASSDGTREICIDYAKQYPDKIRLFLHHRKNNIAINGNPTGRFNFMYNLYSCRGKYIALCEGDDYWTDPLKLQKQVDFLERNDDYIMCFTNTSLMINETIENERWVNIKGDESFCHKDMPIFAPLLTRVFRNQELENLKFSNVPGGDTFLLVWQSKFGKIKFLDQVTSVYRRHGQGVYSSKSLESRTIHQIETRLEILKIIDDNYVLTKFYFLLFGLIIELKKTNKKRAKRCLHNFYKIYSSQMGKFSFKNQFLFGFKFFIFFLPLVNTSSLNKTIESWIKET